MHRTRMDAARSFSFIFASFSRKDQSSRRVDVEQADICSPGAVASAGDRKYELHTREIEEMYEGRVIGSLPEDDIVPISIEEHIPAYIMDYRNRFSKAVAQASRYYANGNEQYQERVSENNKKSFFKSVFKLRHEHRVPRG